MKRQPPAGSGPLSRFYTVEELAALPEGRIAIEAKPEECAALAAANALPSVSWLRASLVVKPEPRGFHVTGEVRAKLSLTCVVTLEDFEAELREAVDVHFAEPPASLAGGRRRAPPSPPPEIDVGDEEPPEPIVNGYANLGKAIAEFFALGIDPYPRKPGVAFEGSDVAREVGPDPARESPFAALARLKGDGKDTKD